MYPVIQLESASRLDTEQLGTKPKFWVQLGNQQWLFKEARPNTGEDWSEKAASELGKRIGVAVADVDLAAYSGRRGSVSRSFVAREQGEALVHGNEILALRVTGYDKAKRFSQQDHTVNNIDQALQSLFHPEQATGALVQLAGYLVLDALISNTDRHHENWGLCARSQLDDGAGRLSVAPSFDHASSLGRELLDEKRQHLLHTEGVGKYVRRGRGGVYLDPSQPRGENPLKLVEGIARVYPDYFMPALLRVNALDDASVRDVFAAIPADRASEVAKRFACEMVLYSRECLGKLLT